MLKTEIDHTKWKKLGVLSQFVSFILPENYKEIFPQYTFHYEAVMGDIDECDYTYIEIDGTPVILEKYLNLVDYWSALVDLNLQNKEFNDKLIDILIKEFNIQTIVWKKFE